MFKQLAFETIDLKVHFWSEFIIKGMQIHSNLTSKVEFQFTKLIKELIIDSFLSL